MVRMGGVWLIADLTVGIGGGNRAIESGGCFDTEQFSLGSDLSPMKLEKNTTNGRNRIPIVSDGTAPSYRWTSKVGLPFREVLSG